MVLVYGLSWLSAEALAYVTAAQEAWMAAKMSI